MTNARSNNQRERALKPALLRGLRLKCPCCGEGAVLHSYLKVNSCCDVCHEDLSHARADDGPAYLTILLICHVVGFALHFVYSHYDPEPLKVALGLGGLSLISALILLPRMKGMIIAIQWAKQMHGFSSA